MWRLKCRHECKTPEECFNTLDDVLTSFDIAYTDFEDLVGETISARIKEN